MESRASTSAALAAEVAPYEGTSPAALQECIEQAAALGCVTIEAPRSLLRAIGGEESAPVRTLRAAFSNDDELLVRALADDVDVARLRAAALQLESNSKSMRTGLLSTMDAFGGGPEREKPIEWSKRLDAVRRVARKKSTMLHAAAAAAGASMDVQTEAAAADSVWESVPDPADAAARVGVLCDSLATVAIDGITLIAPGAGGPGACSIEFAGAPSPIDARSFALALGIDDAVLVARSIRCAASLARSAAQFLADRPSEPAYAWPLMQEPVRLLAPAMTFSASRLNAYANCPRRFFFEYLCAAVDDRPSVHALYGKVFHAALESLHRIVSAPADWQPQTVLTKLSDALDVAFGQSHGEFASQLEYEVLRLRARRVAEHYVRWLFEEAADAPFEVVGIESRQSLTIGDCNFVGYVDRIDRPLGGGPVTIFDYKTGRIDDDPEEYLRKVRSGEEAQLALYYAMHRARGEDVARIALVSIRDSRDKTWILALDITDDAGRAVAQRAQRRGVVSASCSVADLERSLDQLIARCHELTRDGVSHFAAGVDPPCSYCTYERACRERPADGERIFAR